MSQSFEDHMRAEIISIKNQMLIDIIKGGIQNPGKETLIKLPVGSAKDLYQLNIACKEKNVLNNW